MLDLKPIKERWPLDDMALEIMRQRYDRFEIMLRNANADIEMLITEIERLRKERQEVHHDNA